MRPRAACVLQSTLIDQKLLFIPIPLLTYRTRAFPDHLIPDDLEVPQIFTQTCRTSWCNDRSSRSDRVLLGSVTSERDSVGLVTA